MNVKLLERSTGLHFAVVIFFSYQENDLAAKIEVHTGFRTEKERAILETVRSLNLYWPN